MNSLYGLPPGVLLIFELIIPQTDLILKNLFHLSPPSHANRRTATSVFLLNSWHGSVVRSLSLLPHLLHCVSSFGLILPSPLREGQGQHSSEGQACLPCCSGVGQPFPGVPHSCSLLLCGFSFGISPLWGLWPWNIRVCETGKKCFPWNKSL